jgi:hypothetical protein
MAPAAAALVAASSLLLLAGSASAAPGTFQVINNAFTLNGEPMLVRSGSFHYHRGVPEQWEDRMLRLRAMGLNAIQTYVPWNWHELEDGVWDFSGPRNLTQFLQTAADVGLLVLLRPGPYICGEHDFGGFPYYLLNVPGIQLRTNNTQYLQYVDRWWAQLLPLVRPYLISNGGPVAMVQIENEYGSYGNTGGNAQDKAYMVHLMNLAYQYLGGPAPAGVQLYTTDGGDVSYMTGGTLPGLVFATGDGGPSTDVTGIFAAEDQFNPDGWRAHTSSEDYSGWLTHWGEGMANTSTVGLAGGLNALLANNGSFNMYMGYGGTNFGFWNGANGGGTSFQPVITSYDYDSPVSEGGIHGYGPDGDKFATLRQLMTYWMGEEPPAEPPAPAVAAYGTVQLTSSASLWSNLALLAVNATTGPQAAPSTMETYGQAHGYIVYRSAVPAGHDGQKSSLAISGLADRGEVFVSGTSVGVTYRPDAGAGQYTVPAALVSAGATLDILVENMGHINYGHGFFDPKGITGGVAFAGAALTGNWSAFPLPMHFNSTVSRLPFQPFQTVPTGATFFRGSLTVSGSPADTYITLCGWQKGTVWINGNHLGRYWETQGPQHSFYVPSPFLQTGANDVVVFEQHGANSGATVAFVSVPDFTGAVCKGTEGEGQGVHAPVAFPPTARDPALAAERAAERAERIRVHASAAAAAAAAAGEGARAACTTPTAGLGVTGQTCSTISPAASAWTWVPVAAPSANAGLLQLTSAPTLCVSSQGKNPTTGYPALVLVTCDPAKADRSQHFMYFNNLTALSIMSLGAVPGAGMCIDVTGGVNSGPGVGLELYDCNGGDGQAWTFGGQGGAQLVSALSSGLCAAAC